MGEKKVWKGGLSNGNLESEGIRNCIKKGEGLKY